MNTTSQFKTVNTTDVRFRLGSILSDLEKQKAPVLIISRSKPKAWIYPYEQINISDPFSSWMKTVLPKHSKNTANRLIALIRKDRDTR